ncbi:MAG: ammonia-forming cytochrome c nitrite reductase subunit c552 [Planctomycetota bacterium]
MQRAGARVAHRGRLAACLIILGLVAAALPVSGNPSTEGKVSPVPPEDLPLPRRDSGYVSSDACVECHQNEHASWHASSHRTMTQVATPESVLGEFDGAEIDSDGVTYRVFTRDGECWAEMPDPDLVMDFVQQRGRYEMMKKIPRVERRVIMTTGSHHYQTYWVAGDDEYGRLMQTLPLVYLIKDQRWIPREKAFMRPPGGRFLTQWNHHCIKCHSTGGGPGLIDEGQRGRFETKVAELGISCKACHGPGEDHIAYQRRIVAKQPPAGADPIVNPAKLDHKRGSQVCGQCHAVFIAANEKSVTEYATSGSSYRPGDEIHQTNYYIQQPANGGTSMRRAEFDRNKEFFRERWWDDGSILAGGREFTAVRRSACYLKGEMSCMSCHSIHDSDPADQLTRDLTDTRMCTQCHSDPRDTSRLSDHTHHAPGSSGSNCLNCHMPYNSYALLSGVRSHQMESPRVSASVEFDTPNACNLCHLDQTFAWA